MHKKLLAALAAVICLCSHAAGGESFTLSGTVRFQEGEMIFLSLYSHERFLRLRNNPLPPAPFTLALEPTSEERQAGRAHFRFEGIPAGSYALLAFRDKKAPGGPALAPKPASAYKMMRFSGRWEDVKMEVNKNLTGIEIRFDE